MIIRVPGSSANLGPGFDAVGLAVGRYAEVATTAAELPEGRLADEHHPATVAHRLAGGSGPLWVRTDLPMGRGLGYSGAVRVGGILVALAQRDGTDAVTEEQRATAVSLGSRLEGHPDNVAASAYGGVVVSVDGTTISVPLGFEPALVVWIPASTTSTDSSRTQLPDSVPFADAVFNVGRVAALVAALTAGRVDALATATADRLHQPRRFAAAARSRAAFDAALAAGAWCAWLSGSGPTVAALCPPGRVAEVLAALPDDGAGHHLAIDQEGAAVS